MPDKSKFKFANNIVEEFELETEDEFAPVESLKLFFQ